MNRMALGYQELLIILAIVVVLFGASRLPQLGESLGAEQARLQRRTGRSRRRGAH